MPNFKFLKPLSLITAGALVGYFTVQIISANSAAPSQNRFLASATISKIGSEQFARSVFDIKIKNEKVAQTNDDISTVRVRIEAFQKLPAGLTYTWHLPKDAEVVEGSVTGFISELDTNQTQELEIKLKGYSHSEQNHVVFAVKGEVLNSSIDRNVIVSSRPEDSFEYIVQAYEKTKETERKQKNKQGKSASKGPLDPKDVVF